MPDQMTQTNMYSISKCVHSSIHVGCIRTITKSQMPMAVMCVDPRYTTQYKWSNDSRAPGTTKELTYAAAWIVSCTQPFYLIHVILGGSGLVTGAENSLIESVP